MTAVDDKLDILELLGRYSFAADEATSPDEYAAIFTEDGAFHGRVGQPDEVRIEGREALVRFAKGAIRRRTSDRQVRHHQSTTTFVELEGDRALTRTYLMATQVADDAAPVIGLTTIYEDVLVRTDAGWRIQLRRALPDVEGNLYQNAGN